MNIEKNVITIVQKHLGIPEGEVTRGKSFVDDLGCDSLDAIDIVMAIEEVFDIELQDDNFIESNYNEFNIGDAVKMFSDKLTA